MRGARSWSTVWLPQRQCPVPQESLNWASPSELSSVEASGTRLSQSHMGQLLDTSQPPGRASDLGNTLWQTVMPSERMAESHHQKIFSAALSTVGSCKGEAHQPRQQLLWLLLPLYTLKFQHSSVSHEFFQNIWLVLLNMIFIFKIQHCYL